LIRKEEKEVIDPQEQSPSFAPVVRIQRNATFRNLRREEMRKWLFATLVALMIVSLVVACGPTATPVPTEAPTAVPATAEPTEVAQPTVTVAVGRGPARFTVARTSPPSVAV
jgi:hypothetical protein